MRLQALRPCILPVSITKDSLFLSQHPLELFTPGQHESPCPTSGSHLLFLQQIPQCLQSSSFKRGPLKPPKPTNEALFPVVTLSTGRAPCQQWSQQQISGKLVTYNLTLATRPYNWQRPRFLGSVGALLLSASKPRLGQQRTAPSFPEPKDTSPKFKPWHVPEQFPLIVNLTLF